MSSPIGNDRPAPDKVLTGIADYALTYKIESDLAYSTAQHCLIDTLGCGLEALEYPACTKLLGPIVPGTIVPNGARVPAPATSSTPSKPPSTLAPSSAGSTSTTPGSPPSGDIPPTTSAEFSPSPTGSPVAPSPTTNRHSPCATFSQP